MRQTARMLAWLGLTAGAGVVHAGCGTAYDDLYRALAEPAGADNPACAGDPDKDNVTDACGVFARADATGAEDGSQAKPFHTLQKAIDAAKGKRVYACSSAPFAESVTITTAVEVVGGLDCQNGWAWKASDKSTLNGPAGAVALTLQSEAKDVKFSNFKIIQASATEKGASSIAVAVADVAAALVRCDIFAGDGADGEDGIPPAGTVMKGAQADAPQTMNASNACVAPNAVFGGLAGTTTCDDGDSAGGVGGTGGATTVNGGAGEAGADGTPADATEGLGGEGASGTLSCKDGSKGKDGDPGEVGAGGQANTTADDLSLTSITGGDGGDGSAGKRGQGGGGGGAARSGTFCPFQSMFIDGVGASGGGGGAGGCGGKGGGGGKAGGSSIGILSLGAGLTLTEVTVTMGKAGKGGAGAIGQGGGVAGLGASGGAASGFGTSKAGCHGGDGGAGGAGGPGGGGRGGHAIGVAFAVTPTAAPTLATFTASEPGSGGAAGPGGSPGGNGAPGLAGPCWDFSTNAACGGQ